MLVMFRNGDSYNRPANIWEEFVGYRKRCDGSYGNGRPIQGIYCS